MGSRKVSGISQLGPEALVWARSFGGVGAAVYSVRERPLNLGVAGLEALLVDDSSDIMVPRGRQEIKTDRVQSQWEEDLISFPAVSQSKDSNNPRNR